MEVRVAGHLDRFTAWLARQDKPPFAQSAAWGAILSAEGKQVELLEVYDGEHKIAQALGVIMPLMFGWQYVFFPKGPVMIEGISDSEVLQALQEYYQTKKSIIFLRAEPAKMSLSPASLKSIDINPRATTLLDLHTTTDALLDKMHQKTRYNIRLAEKKTMTLRHSKDLEILLNLLQLTGKRDGFSLHDRKHYEQILLSPLSQQITAWLGDAPVATAVFVGCGNMFTYLYGASDYQHRALMAPYLLQWAAIQQAKEKGYRWYDFFGIAPVEMKDGEYQYDQKHQYAGVTRFKLGFGGDVVEQPGTYDLLISPFKYRMYALLRTIRRWF